MEKVVAACNTFEGDLAGKFYPLEGMSKEDQNQLIEDHFLFKYVFTLPFNIFYRYSIFTCIILYHLKF